MVKQVALVYRANREIKGTKIGVIWSKTTRPSGVNSLEDIPFIA